MFTAKIINKEEVKNRLVLGVEFTDGKKTITENITPQDKDSFERWVKSRLDALNSITDLEKEVAIDDIVDPVVTEPEPTQAEKDEKVWLRKMRRLETIKTSLIDTGVFTGLEKPIEDLRADLKATFKPAYLNKI